MNSEKLVLVSQSGKKTFDLLDELCLDFRSQIDTIIKENPESNLKFMIVLAKLENDNPNVLMIAKVKELFSQHPPYPSSLSFTCIRNTDHFLLKDYSASFTAAIIIDEKGRIESSVIKDNKILFSYLKNVVVKEKLKPEEQTGYVLTEFDTTDRLESLS